MSQANPHYKYYKQLAGIWKSNDGLCVVTLTDTVGITVSYNGAVLEDNYGIIKLDSLTETNNGGMMMAFSGMPGFSKPYKYHTNEDIQLTLGNKLLKKDGQTLFNINAAWHDNSDQMHIEISDVKTGRIDNILLNRENVSAAAVPLKEGECRCECGQVFSSKFCPNCGKMREENKTFTCSCGYTGPARNFCPECGKPCSAPVSETEPPVQETKPAAGWTCSQCGALLQTGDKCNECGAEIRKEMLFSIFEYMTCNPPRYDGITVWKFSDTRLIMQRGDDFHFIPATVIEPAMKVIREYEIDKWEEYKDQMNGAMGGAQYVSYWDGEKMAGTSTDHMPGAAGAYVALRNLFTSELNG